MVVRAYPIIDHRGRRAERHSRDNRAAKWLREDIAGVGRVRIPWLDVELTLDEIYER